jgi:hypothetical protein
MVLISLAPAFLLTAMQQRSSEHKNAFEASDVNQENSSKSSIRVQQFAKLLVYFQ